MGVTLERAWQVARLMEEADAARAQQEVDRALALSAPSTGSGKADGGQAMRQAAREAARER